MKIAIIGGGAAGMMAAITASESGADVTIYEHMARVGKKILVTGSGKCNIANEDTDLVHYHSSDDNLSLVKNVFSHVSPASMLAGFTELGLVTKNKRGYIYPFSEQASSVLDILRFAIRDRNIRVIVEAKVTSVDSLVIGGFTVNTTDGSDETFDRIIIAAGSCANKKTGSDGSGYEIAKAFGHSIVKPLPALTYLECKENYYSSVAGIRTSAKVTICGQSEEGQLQFTKTGISGINVFNLSYLAAKSLDNGEDVSAFIDFMPDMETENFRDLMYKRVRDYKERPLEELFIGILNKNLGHLIIKESGIFAKFSDLCSELTVEDIKRIVQKTKNFEVKVKACGGFDNSQVICGGVDTTEVNDKLESLKTPGVYFAGEILDVNGDCGGYNLTFAFCSGIYAGLCAANEHDKN